MFDDATHFTLKRLQQLEKVLRVDDDYDVLITDDIIVVDASSNTVDITLPYTKGFARITVVALDATNTITVYPQSPQTINGTTSATISSAYEPHTYKAMPATVADGWVEV